MMASYFQMSKKSVVHLILCLMIFSPITQTFNTRKREEKYSALALCHCQNPDLLALWGSPHFWSIDPVCRKGSMGFSIVTD